MKPHAFTTAGLHGGRYHGVNQDAVFITSFKQSFSIQHMQHYIQDTFEKLDEHIAAMPEAHHAGTTCSMVMVNAQTLVVGNVGDSPVFLMVKEHGNHHHHVHKLYVEHSTENPEALAHAVALGAKVFINSYGKKRIHGNAGSLNLTKILGDNDIAGLSHQPDIRTFNMADFSTHEDDVVTLVVASDGLTENKMCLQELAQIACDETLSTQEIPELLAHATMFRTNGSYGSRDNISVIVQTNL